MESLQPLIVIFCLIFFIGKSSAFDNDIVLSRITFKEKNKSDDIAPLTILFKATTPIDGVDHNLIFTDEKTRAQLLVLQSTKAPADFGDGMQSIDFNIKTDDYPRITDLNLVLTLTSHGTAGIMEGDIEIMIEPTNDSPVVPKLDNGKLHTIDRRNNKLGKNIVDLRIAPVVPVGFTLHASMGDLGSEATCPATSGTATGCYTMGANVPAATTFSVCKNIAVATTPELLQCSDEFNSADAADGFEVCVISVNYETSKIQLTPTVDYGSTEWEMQIHHGEIANPWGNPIRGDDINNIVSSKVEEAGDHDILLVGLMNGVVTEYKKFKVKDAELSAEALGENSKIIEVNIENMDEKLFHMVLVPAVVSLSDTDYQVADVDCREILTGPCRGYFVNVDDGDYQITVNKMTVPEKKKPSIIDTKLEYISNKVVIPGVAQLDTIKDIEMENIQVKQEIFEKAVKFSFKYKCDIRNKTASHEIILINNRGKWKRSVMKPKSDDSYGCSTTMNLPLEKFGEDYEIKIIVLSRDISTDKVIATGEKTLNIAVHTAIKPEVDNGSKGSTSTLAIVGAAIGGIACLMALVAAAIMFVIKINRDNDGLQYPLHRTKFEDSSIIHGLDNPIPNM